MSEDANKKVLNQIYRSLQEKGYRPVCQIVGYLLTEDPTYITNHNHARQLAQKLDRNAVLQDIVASHFTKDQDTQSETSSPTHLRT
jgi:uncharacterized protein (UPF0297 family)